MIVDNVRAVLARVMNLFLFGVASIGLAAAPAVLAQDDDADAVIEEAERAVDEVVVTGSRLKRDTYSSISPLQVITTQSSREVGAIDPGKILQESTSAAGSQVDLTFNGFVLDNGPGASTIDLRGLGASRTLVLINGRRAAPAGVEGAPVHPDLNLVPSTLVQQYEVLLDGASSIYGSDAIAGVTNIILRKDFEGLELESYTSIPSEDEGLQNTVSAAWGWTGDRGFFGVAAEFTKADPIAFDDRPWTAGCNTHYELDENGNIRTEGLEYQAFYGMEVSPCTISFGRRSWDDYAQFGSLYYTPGTSNVGIPNLSEATIWDVPLDQNLDGMPDVDFNHFNTNGEQGDAHMFPEHERISAMAYGEYTFSGEMNVTPYFEANYNKRETYVYEPGSVMDIEVPADNPFNPCNPNGMNGVDCGAAYDAIMRDPIFSADWAAVYGATPQWYLDNFGLDWLFNDPYGTAPFGATPLRAQASIVGNLSGFWAEVDQLRFVAGVKGDLPGLTFGSLDNWSFDLAVVHSESGGKSRRTGVNEVALRHSLETTVWDPVTGALTCGNGSDGCVVVNPFAPELYVNLVDNDFATQAERDYVMADRKFDTSYKQTLVNGFVSGDVFRLPGGEAMLGIGIEFRKDDMDSIPNDVAAEGMLLDYFADRGAVGEKDTNELFAELELPLFAGYTGMRELTVNLSSRYTKDEFYGGAETYSAKIAYRPIDSLLIRGTVGTSYRAPNLREIFIEAQTGFRYLNDPCVTPEDAVTPTGYDPTRDDREQWIIDNCYAAGVDPTNLGVIASGQSAPDYWMEVATAGGGTELDEEKSESWTAGFAFEQPWFEAFDMSIGATYYEVEMRDEIIQLHSQYSINDCYDDLEGDSAFCGNITRDLAGDGLITYMEEIFINQDSLKARGVDLNIAFDWPTQIFGRALDVSADLTANRKFELTSKFINPFNGAVDSENYVGQFGVPKWEGHALVRFDMGKWRVTWSTRYIDAVAEHPLAADDFGNVLEGGGDTCLGPLGDDVSCKDIGWAEHYYRHDMSVYYRGDVWTLGAGVRNLQNEWPPQVDNDARIGYVFNNTPMGQGYDIFGRTYFVNIQAAFE